MAKTTMIQHIEVLAPASIVNHNKASFYGEKLDALEDKTGQIWFSARSLCQAIGLIHCDYKTMARHIGHGSRHLRAAYIQTGHGVRRVLFVHSAAAKTFVLAARTTSKQGRRIVDRILMESAGSPPDARDEQKTSERHASKAVAAAAAGIQLPAIRESAVLQTVQEMRQENITMFGRILRSTESATAVGEKTIETLGRVAEAFQAMTRLVERLSIQIDNRVVVHPGHQEVPAQQHFEPVQAAGKLPAKPHYKVQGNGNGGNGGSHVVGLDDTVQFADTLKAKKCDVFVTTGETKEIDHQVVHMVQPLSDTPPAPGAKHLISLRDAAKYLTTACGRNVGHKKFIMWLRIIGFLTCDQKIRDGKSVTYARPIPIQEIMDPHGKHYWASLALFKGKNRVTGEQVVSHQTYLTPEGYMQIESLMKKHLNWLCNANYETEMKPLARPGKGDPLHVTFSKPIYDMPVCAVSDSTKHVQRELALR
jgi:hypothetical protein